MLCLEPGLDFTASELGDVAQGSLGPIYTHLKRESRPLDTDQMNRIRGILMEHYQRVQKEVAYEQGKLQSMGSIGLFSDGNKDNSSYDLMVDLENIHSVIFAKDIPYNGTDNMGAVSVANLLANLYPHPLLPLNPLSNTFLPKVDPGVSLISPGTLTGLTLSGLLNNGSGCAPSQVPVNLDPSFLLDAQAQLLVGTNPNSSIAFSDDAKLPEYWARIAQGSGALGGSPGSAGAGADSFPCSGKDFFCILISMTDYSQNILGGQMNTIEKILDENLKIANKFAPSSFVQAKMTKMFFGLSLKNLDLPSMLHIGIVQSSLPPPILNFKKGTTGGETNVGATSKEEEDEINKVLVGTFEEVGLDFKRQNSLERNNESRAVHNLTYITTDSVIPKTDTTQAPVKSGYIRAKEVELRRAYGDSFNDDLFELHSFTLAFAKQIETITNIITGLHAIPQK